MLKFISNLKPCVSLDGKPLSNSVLSNVQNVAKKIIKNIGMVQQYEITFCVDVEVFETYNLFFCIDESKIKSVGYENVKIPQGFKLLTFENSRKIGLNA
jgi:hypothetical protein